LPKQDFYQIFKFCRGSEGREGMGITVDIEICNLQGDPIKHETNVQLDPAEKYMDVILVAIDIDSSSPDQSVRTKQALSKEVHHQLMNKLASIKGYSELIQSSTDVPGPIRDYAAEVITNSEQVRSVLETGSDTTSFCKSMDELANKYNLSFSGEPQIPSNISAIALDQLIASTVVFMDEEGAAGNQRDITTMSEKLVRCSGCDRDLDDTSFVITITDEDLFFDREHFKCLLLTGFVTTTLGETTNLTEVSDMVHRHGGHIRLARGDEGFSVDILYPVFQEVKPVLSSDRENGNSILIIDDDLSVANYLKVVIERAGYSATTFTKPREALALFRQDPGLFDLVITDQTMPGLSGDAVMKTLLELRPELPIIMCTGYSESVDAETALELGAAGYVNKPVEVSHLLQLIRNAIGAPSE
jgi:CheY-like chemotaxis protein